MTFVSLFHSCGLSPLVLPVLAEQINASTGFGLSTDFLIRTVENRAIAWRPKLEEA
jgi:hypothetical protein